MANRNTKAARKRASKESNSPLFFHGKPCVTCFDKKDLNPMNKRKSPWHPARKQTGANRD